MSHTRIKDSGRFQEAWLMTIFIEKKIGTDEGFMALFKDGHRYGLLNEKLSNDLYSIHLVNMSINH
jgi:hypothetical protein